MLSQRRITELNTPIYHEVVERYCPYVNHNVTMRRGPRTVCMEAGSCPVRAKIDCKNDTKKEASFP